MEQEDEAVNCSKEDGHTVRFCCHVDEQIRLEVLSIVEHTDYASADQCCGVNDDRDCAWPSKSIGSSFVLKLVVGGEDHELERIGEEKDWKSRQ